MDEALISNFNSVVSSKDIVWHLGDFYLHSSNHMVEDYLYRLNGKEHHLILGNHDKRSECEGVLHSVQCCKFLKLPNTPGIFISHYAHRVWPQSHYGSIHLFGHSHGKLVVSGNLMDVGIDATGYFPLKLEDIINIFNKKILTVN